MVSIVCLETASSLNLNLLNMLAKNDPPSYDDLPSDVLGRVFKQLPLETRANTVALVSKTWEAADRAFPAQPTKLAVHYCQDHCRQCGPSLEVFVSRRNWILRGSHNLEVMHYDASGLQMQECVEGMEFLRRSPVLHTLTFFLPPRPPLDPVDHHWLPLLAAASGLRRLEMTGWTYASKEIPLMAHISGLHSLEALDLEEVRAVVAGKEALSEVVNRAGDEFRRALLTMTHLTELKLNDVVFQHRLFPAGKAADWDGLRSVKYTNLNKPPASHLLGLPGLARLTKLERLVVDVSSHIAGDPPDRVTPTCHMNTLAGLVGLKDLTVDLPMNFEEITISPIATVTHLQLNRHKYMRLMGVKMAGLDSMLPWRTTRNLRELVIQSGVWDDFPATFSRLGQLTKLHFAFHRLPPTLLNMKSLVEVSVARFATHMFGPLCHTYPLQDHILKIVGALPNLARLDSVVSVGNEAFGQYSQIQQQELDDILVDVPQRFPRLTLTATMMTFRHFKFCLGN